MDSLSSGLTFSMAPKAKQHHELAPYHLQPWASAGQTICYCKGYRTKIIYFTHRADFRSKGEKDRVTTKINKSIRNGHLDYHKLIKGVSRWEFHGKAPTRKLSEQQLWRKMWDHTVNE